MEVNFSVFSVHPYRNVWNEPMGPSSVCGAIPVQLPLSHRVSSRILAGSCRSSAIVTFAVFFQYDFYGDHSHYDADRFRGYGSVCTATLIAISLYVLFSRAKFLFDSCPAAQTGAPYRSTDVDTLARSLLVPLLTADLFDMILVNAAIALAAFSQA